MSESLRYPHVAILGKAGSGKTTMSENLVKYHGYRRLSFASALKDVAAQIWGPGAKTDREKLQRLGVAVRDIDEDAWVNVLLREVQDIEGRDHHHGTHTGLVIDDCRFPNEYWALCGAGFRFIRLLVPLQERRARLTRTGKFTTPEQEQHISETALDDARMDIEIWNREGEIETVWNYLQEIILGWAR